MKSSLYIAILLRSSDSKTAGNLDLLYFTGMGLCFFVIVDANQQDRSAKLAECFGIIPALICLIAPSALLSHFNSTIIAGSVDRLFGTNTTSAMSWPVGSSSTFPY